MDHEMKDIICNSLKLYLERDKNMAFSEWLADRFQQKIPDTSKEGGRKLSCEIVQAVSDYDRELEELNLANAKRQSKEDWYAEHIFEICASMSWDAAAEKLHLLEKNLTQTFSKADKEAADTDAGLGKWNEYRIKDKIYDIARKIILLGLFVVTDAIKMNMQSDEKASISKIVRETFQEGLKRDSKEIKAAVAGSIEIIVKKGLENALPSDTPIEVICGMAWMIVECVDALLDFISGECTLIDAVDQIGKVSIVAFRRYSLYVLKGFVLHVPVVGQFLVECIDMLLKFIADSKIYENVYTAFHNLEKGIKETVKREHTKELVFD